MWGFATVASEWCLDHVKIDEVPMNPRCRFHVLVVILLLVTAATRAQCAARRFNGGGRGVRLLDKPASRLPSRSCTNSFSRRFGLTSAIPV
jgi:hypothetical protein